MCAAAFKSNRTEAQPALTTEPAPAAVPVPGVIVEFPLT